MAQNHNAILLYKSANRLLPTRYVFTIYETFQMRYCMKFYLKGHQIYNKSKWKVWLLVLLMSLEIKLHSVPHLKGLINGENIFGSQERAVLRCTATDKTLEPFCFVWSKMGTSQMRFWLSKSTVTLLSTRYALTINETFQMRYCMKFHPNRHQKYKQSNFRLSKFT